MDVPGADIKTDKFSGVLVNYSERLHQQEPLPIFIGAVLANGNELLTNKSCFVTMFQEMQAGTLPFPESLKDRVDYVDIIKDQRYILPQSEQIEGMFIHLRHDIGIRWDWVQSKETGDYIGERYSLSDEVIYNFLEKWGNDYEMLKFCKQSADYLAISE